MTYIRRKLAEMTQRRFLALLLILVITITTTPLSGASTANARVLAIEPVVPDACLNDQGDPVIPRILEDGTRALALNFNHAPSYIQTEGCIATRNPDPESFGGIIVDGIGYEVEFCDIIGNPGLNAIGNGTAHFDGTFHIECDMFVHGYNIPLFYVFATASFFQSGNTEYILMDHPDVSVGARVENDWGITLASRYNGTFFSNTDTGVDRTGKITPLFTRVINDVGKHNVDGQLLQPTAKVPSFDFATYAPIEIGHTNGSAAWDLHFIVIDPPNGKH